MKGFGFNAYKVGKLEKMELLPRFVNIWEENDVPWLHTSPSLGFGIACRPILTSRIV